MSVLNCAVKSQSGVKKKLFQLNEANAARER